MILFFDNSAKPGGKKGRPAFSPPSEKTEALLSTKGAWDGQSVVWTPGPVTETRLTAAEVESLIRKHGSPHFNRDRAYEVKKRMQQGRSLPQIKSELKRLRRHGYGERQIEKDHAALLPHLTR